LTVEDDPHDLSRFLLAQENCYLQALAEIRAGRKQSHWMWYVFPQFQGLGLSSTSRLYAIKSAAEAHAYLRHPILGARPTECCAAAVAIDGRSAAEVFGSPRRHEAAVLRNAVCGCDAARLGVRAGARKVLPWHAG